MTGLPKPLPAAFTAAERAEIERAYAFADRCHAGQVRKSGDPYITHSVAVAQLAIEAGLDCATVCAALLHDVIEDTDCDAARLRTEFGGEVVTLVQSMSELDRRHDPAAIDSADDRVLALKVFDRLHNLRTIRHLDQERQRVKSRHSLDIVAPVARRLGLRSVADELESLARDCLARLPGDTSQVLAVGALLLPRGVRVSYLEEWLGELDLLEDRRTRGCFVLRLVLRMPALALALRRHPGRRVLTSLVLNVLRWILRTDLRTWTPLTAMLGWLIVESAGANLGDAVVILITVPPVLYSGVTCLRRKLGLDAAGPSK